VREGRGLLGAGWLVFWGCFGESFVCLLEFICEEWWGWGLLSSPPGWKQRHAADEVNAPRSSLSPYRYCVVNLPIEEACHACDRS
jgi:hypothetical protein